jgi:hypothetical protein
MSQNVNSDNYESSSQMPKKKRGRPRKNQVSEKPKMLEKKKNPVTKQNQEILLHLPISFGTNKKSASDSEKNRFTMKPSDDEDTEEDSDNMRDTTILSISDDESSASQNNQDILDLKEELTMKDKIIRKLKDELLECKSLINDYNTTTNGESKVTQMNLNLVDNKTGKSIICEKTNTACWWCTYQFTNMPCFIPDKYYEASFYVFGCFCSYNCAAAYNLNINDYKVSDRHSLIKKLYNMTMGNTDDVSVSAQRELLEKFGGPLRIDEYRKNSRVVTKEYKVLVPPLVYIIPHIEEKVKEKPLVFKQDVNKFSSADDDKSMLYKPIPISKKSTRKLTLFDSMCITERN